MPAVVIRTVEHEIILAFDRANETQLWHTRLSNLIQTVKGQVLPHVCFSALELPVGQHKANKCIIQLDMVSHSIYKVSKRGHICHGFKRLFNIRFGDHHSLTLVWAGKTPSDTFHLSSEKERTLWQHILQGIATHKGGFKLSSELALLLRPLKIGFAQQHVGLLWKARWFELMPYGEFIIFSESPASGTEVKRPLETYKVS
jgi:hypothetical protein